MMPTSRFPVNAGRPTTIDHPEFMTGWMPPLIALAPASAREALGRFQTGVFPGTGWQLFEAVVPDDGPALLILNRLAGEIARRQNGG